MKILGAALMVAVLVGCTGGSPASDGGGGGAGGGAGGGNGDAGPSNLLPGDFEGVGKQVLIALDGGAVVVGAVVRPDSGTAGDLMLARCGGTLARDPAFGTDGVAVADFDGGTAGGGLINIDFDFGAAAVFDGDKLVAVGSARGESAGGYDFAIARFTANGQLDPSFGTGGTVLNPYGVAAGGAQLNNLVVTGGKYLVCGPTGSNTGNVLLRYNSDGTLDPGFVAAGTPPAGNDALCGSLLMQGDKPLTTGASFTIARYNAGGGFDLSFGSQGAYTTTGKLGGAHLRADGKIWLVGSETVTVGGTDTDYLKQVLLSADGVPDSSFGTAGVLSTQLNVSQVRGSAMQGNKLVVYIPSVPARLIRLDADGSLDATFGTAGAIPVPFKLPLFDAVFDPHHHLTVNGTTAWVTDVDLVGAKSRLGLFTTALP